MTDWSRWNQSRLFEFDTVNEKSGNIKRLLIKLDRHLMILLKGATNFI